jgi:hypothetical protein
MQEGTPMIYDEHGNPTQDPRVLAVADKLEPFLRPGYDAQARAAIARTLVEEADAKLTLPERSPATPDVLDGHFDANPEALAWARRKVSRAMARASRLETEARARGGIGDDAVAKAWRKHRYLLESSFLGKGYIVGVFDERLPTLDGLQRAAATLTSA